MDNLNPKFIKKFTLQYKFEERQQYKIKVYDIDDPSPAAPLDHHDFIGDFTFALHELVTARDMILTRGLHNDKR